MCFKCDEKIWLERPAAQQLIDAAVINVMYLLELRVKLIEKMLCDFVNGVDIFLGLHRDASSQRLTLLEVRVDGYGSLHNCFLRLCAEAFRKI